VGITEKGNRNAKGGKYYHNFEKNNNSNTQMGKDAKFEGREEKLKG